MGPEMKVFPTVLKAFTPGCSMSSVAKTFLVMKAICSSVAVSTASTV